MATSTEQINELIASNTALKAYFEGVQDSIDARLNSAASRWENFETVFNVDQSMGDDANDGTQASPLATIQEAINRAPFLGRCVVVVRGNYVSDQRLENYGRYVRIAGAQADWTVDLTNHIDFTLGTAVSSNLIHTLGFSIGWGGSWEIYGCALKAKTLAQVTADHPGASVNGNTSAIFMRPDTGRGYGGTAQLRWSTIDITADPYVTVLGGPTLTGLQVDSVTQTNPLAGRWISGVSAGTPAESIPNLITNLSTL